MAGHAPPTDPAGVERPVPLHTFTNESKKKVAYFYDSDIGNYAYVTGHPMKPHRIRMAHSLVMNYDIYKHMEIYVSDEVTRSPCIPQVADLSLLSERNLPSLTR